MSLKTLITGASGKLGKELLKVIPDALHPSSRELDITNEKLVSEFIDTEKPDLVVHCAAITGIRECEENQEKAWRVNVVGTENLINALEKTKKDLYLVYISTACVFHGDRGNYVETDLPYPKNFYALTKLLSESIIQHSKVRKSLIIRTNFVGREQWPYEKAFVDRFGTYLFADDLSLAISQVIQKGLDGILHVCGEEKMSMFDLAKITTPNVKPMNLSEYNGPLLTIDMTLKSIKIGPFKITR